MVYIFFGTGFEEIEGIAPVDILRRGGVEVTTVGIGGKTIVGAHEIPVVCDITDDQLDEVRPFSAVVLPGGPGTEKLGEAPVVKRMVDKAAANGKVIGAICAAPMILGNLGYLAGRNATIFPGMEAHLKGATWVNAPVVTDGNIITANAAGNATRFALTLLEHLKGRETAQKIGESIQCPRW